MGADKNDPVEIELTEDQQQTFEDALSTLQDLVDEIHEHGTPIREFSLGLTKMEEAEMWIERGFRALGIEPEDGNEEDEEEGASDEDGTSDTDGKKGDA